MAQSPSAWATHILDLSQKINSSRKSIHPNKCYILRRLLDVTVQYVNCWIDQFREETKRESANAVGEKLLGVLEGALRLILQCGERKYAKLLSIILCGAGEFSEIVDHAKRYSTMMNKLIREFNPAKYQPIKELQDKVELDFRRIGEALISAHEQDRNALINRLKSSVKDTESKLDFRSSRAKRLKRYTLKVLIERLETGSGSSIACNIGDIYLLRKEATPLGTGSFGNVSKALWGDEMPVAVKEFFYNEDFEREYKVLTKLMSTDCSHVVQILGHSGNGIDTKKTLIMELMDMDLKKLIENRKENPLSLYESTDLILQIAKGMRGLHKVDVIHRDLKPSNILVKENTEDKRLTMKLADFGESKAEFQTTSPNLHTMTGTQLYMAPEMAADKGKYSKKVDVYSFGLICIEILTGKPPNSIVTDLRKGLMPFFLPSIPIPTDLYTMICDCLEEDKDKRPDFEKICEDLWALMEKVLIREDEIQSYIDREDEIQSYIDEKAELNFRIYTKTLGEEGSGFEGRAPHR